MNYGQSRSRYLSVLVVLLLAAALVALPAGGVSAATDYTWKWQNPLPTGNHLTDVSALDANNVWAVGDVGTILHYDGDSWNQQESGTTEMLLGVSALDASNVWAVGGSFTSGTILHYDGNAWSEQESGMTDIIWGVSALDANNVWAVTDLGVILHYDGDAWSEQYSGEEQSLRGVSALDAENVWAVGQDGTILHYDGESWSEQESGATDMLLGVSALDTENVWAVGGGFESGIILHYDGESWSEQESGATMGLSTVSSLNAGNVWATGLGGAIFHYNGDFWSEEESGTNRGLCGVSALDESNVWAVGDWGTILYNQGANWSHQSYSVTTDDLHSVSALDAGNLWAVGGGVSPGGYTSSIVHYDGTSWSEQYSGTGERLYGVSALNESNVWAVGGWDAAGDFYSTILHYDGNSWSEQYSTEGTSLDKVSALDEGNVWAVGNNFVEDVSTILHYDGNSWSEQLSLENWYLRNISALDANNVWAVGGDNFTGGIILHYDGNSWSEQLTLEEDWLDGVYALDESNVWAVGSFGTILHYDGESWSEQESGEDEYMFYGVQALDANNVWVAGCIYNGALKDSGIILHYDGASWGEQAHGTNNHYLFGVSVPDAGNVWVVGEAGAIFHGSPVAPSIDSITPTSGEVGTTVTVNGTNFGSSGGDSYVSFGDGKASSYGSWSDTQVKTKVPEGVEGKVKVTVTTAGGTSNSKDFTVTTPPPPPPSATTWYLAEGTNAWGFSTYITIENPEDKTLNAKITYMDPAPAASGNGIVGTRDVTLPPLSQTTVSSEPDIGAVDFSTEVECEDGKTIAVDRTMFWTGEGYSPEQTGYHNSIGTTSPAKTWYLPEGSSAWGFETWTLVLNPNDTEANVTLTYMTESGPVPVHEIVPANCRASYSMASDIGTHDASIQVESDVPVIAERSMYRNDRREGSCSIGATSPANDFFLAEGATGYDVGFTTWVLVQNPQETTNDVTLTYQTQAGEVSGPAFTMQPNSRKTVLVNESLPPNTNVSTTVHGSKPLIAERAVYFDNGTGEAFHSSVGLDSPHMTFMLPDGQTSEGFETWTLVANPNPGAVTVRVTYLPQGGGNPVTFTSEIPPGTRSTYDMADRLPSGRASILVQSLDGARPVMCERAMYKNDRGAGTDTIGGYSD